MEQHKISEKVFDEFRRYLICEEKSKVTIDKYLHDVRNFCDYADSRIITKELVLEYKQSLVKQYAARSVNSKLAAINSLFSFLDWSECKVKNIKIQRRTFSSETEELSKAEYFRLVKAANKKPRLSLIIETICGTGIRVSELQYFTMENVSTGTVSVCCKSKTRNVLVPGKLRKRLLDYARKQGIKEGIIFRTRSGKPINRSNIWGDMKKLCTKASVDSHKVFPHNLRKLFARTFYRIEKDIAKLADILGHTNIDTTRIYIMTTGKEHRKKMERMGLIV